MNQTAVVQGSHSLANACQHCLQLCRHMGCQDCTLFMAGVEAATSGQTTDRKGILLMATSNAAPCGHACTPCLLQSKSRRNMQSAGVCLLACFFELILRI